MVSTPQLKCRGYQNGYKSKTILYVAHKKGIKKNKVTDRFLKMIEKDTISNKKNTVMSI